MQRALSRTKASTHIGILRGNNEVGVGGGERAGKKILRSQEQRAGDHGVISGALISVQNGVGKPLEGFEQRRDLTPPAKLSLVPCGHRWEKHHLRGSGFHGGARARGLDLPNAYQLLQPWSLPVPPSRK